MAAEVHMPASPTGSKNNGGASEWKPYDVDPELAITKIGSDMIKDMGTPTVLNSPFVVRQGIFEALNHTPTNRTGYDSSLRCAVYRNVARNSVNVNGMYFEKFWQWLMKPKMIIQGLAGQPAFSDEPKSSIWERYAPTWLGGKGGDKPDGTKPQ